MSCSTYLDHPLDTHISEALTDLALDLRWSFNHSADRLWQQLDPELWDLTHNPWVLLQTVSQEKLQRVTADPSFQTLLADLHQEKTVAEESQAWFQKTHPRSGVSTIAYFSMEFMLSEALPIYSGGLGNVAGDQLKAASNLGVPVTGVGLLYQQGYFRQEIDAQGHQQALYPFNDPGQLPIRPVRETNGEWLRLVLPLPGFNLWIRVWQVQVGRAKLYLLDTNDPANPPTYRGITTELYGGGPELRLKQELVLGVGGWRLLRALGLHPEVCHLNEGHAAFAVLERARSYMEDNSQPFDLALTITRAGNIFTTHTPVEAGFDRFAPSLLERYLRKYAEERLSISFQDILALGRRNHEDTNEPFNMAYLAVRGSGAVNGVSKLHGQVSRRIFQVLFPRWPENEVPITHVTNGVHTPTWDSPEADRMWELACGKDRWREELADVGKDIAAVQDSDLWQLRANNRKALVDYVRKLYVRQLATRGASPGDLAQAARILDDDILTLGFARRFAPYKRPNLLLHDPERLLKILMNPERPVQLVLAGKAHPQDTEGQDMIRQWVEFARRPEVRSRVVFLSDYDVLMAEHLVQGVDVWINTPRRPWEASGTSGMKVLVNGGLNLSELDGWWAEAYSPEVGWAIGDGREHGDDPSWDASEAETLYALLESNVIPEFYGRDERGIPRPWVARMRASMARLTPTFSANRAVRQYTDERYLSAAAAFRRRHDNRGSLGSDLIAWQADLAKHWSSVRFGSASVQQQGQQYFFQVQVYLDDLNSEAVKVELYADGGQDTEAITQTMARGEPLVGSANGFTYTAVLPANRPAADFTPRLVAQHEGALVPLEAPFILWHTAPSWR
ncbi:MAG TPA: alpha-glucan family phosphorylase [Candidatus Acidoferrales bacterium]|nr:alpha-glucan family phosphorylase [Candidatus Acidoferrales bacterium]